MEEESSARKVMGNYLKIIDPEEVTEGFQPANPATLEVTKMVMKELKRNQFKGDDSQDPWEHLINFKETCALQKRTGKVTDDQKKLFLFSYSLARQAKDWLYCLPARTIETWKDLEEKFLEKYFTKSQYDERKAELLEFKQERKESLSQSYERFKLLKR
ncbi:putative athila retroelement ORF1 protein, partial [Trifolium medium]|nr:putative athila retroelement ORF1 protein [Trifolium medium]